MLFSILCGIISIGAENTLSRSGTAADMCGCACFLTSTVSLRTSVGSAENIILPLEKGGNNPAVYERFSAPGNCYFGDCCNSNIGELAMTTLYDTICSLKDDAAYSAALKRMYEVTACKEWEKLAEYLGVRLSILSDARRRKRVPPEILLILLFKLSVNPAWILTGEGARFLQPSDADNPSSMLLSD